MNDLITWALWAQAVELGVRLGVLLTFIISFVAFIVLIRRSEASDL